MKYDEVSDIIDGSNLYLLSDVSLLQKDVIKI